MKDKIKKALAGAKLGWLKNLLLIVALSFIATVGAVLIWLRFQSLDYYKIEMQEKLKSAFHLRSAKVASLEWDFEWKSFSFGVQAKNIRGSGQEQLRSLSVSDAHLTIRLWRLLLGKVALDVAIKGAKFDLEKKNEAASEDVSSTKTPPLKALSMTVDEIPFWLRFIRINFRLDEALFHIGQEGRDEGGIHLTKVDMKGLLSGFPGTFEGNLETDADVDWDEGKYVAKGPIKVEMNGVLQSVKDKAVVGAQLDNFEVDLSKVEFRLMSLLEKSDDVPLKLETSAQIIFADAAQHSADITWKGGKLSYDEVEIALNGSHTAYGTELHWALSPKEVHALKLPVQDLRKIHFSGLVESNGQLRLVKDGELEGSWKVSLNNMRADGSSLKQIGRTGLVSGHVTLSFVSEGSIENGHFSSPRTELQMNGTNAQISFLNRAFVKPNGDVLDLLLRMNIRDDKLLLEKFHLIFHALDVEAQASLESVGTYLKGAKTPMKLEVKSNHIDMSRWSHYFPDYKKAPSIEGFAEGAGAVEGNIKKGDGAFDELAWRIDRFYLSHMRANFFADTAQEILPSVSSGIQLRGPLEMNLLFQGRGIGSRIERATLISRGDLTKTNIFYKDSFRKSANVPLLAEVSMEQSHNQLNIRKGQLQFHNLDLSFSGLLQPGTRKASLNVNMKKPVHLAEWKTFFPKMTDVPLDGRILWKGSFALAAGKNMEESFDWSRLGLEGELRFDSVTGLWGDFAHPIRDGKGSILLQSGGITLPQFSFSIGQAQVQLAANIQSLKASRVATRGPLILSDFMKNKAWDVNSELSLNRLSMEDWEDKKTLEAVENRPANMKREAVENVGERVATILNNKYLPQSRIRVALRAKEGNFSTIKYKNLFVKTEWEKNVLRLEPMSLGAMGGKITGGLRADVSPFYNRKENPEIQAHLQVDQINVKQVAEVLKPDLAPLIAGSLNASLTLSSQGLDPEELISKSTGRLQGNLERGEFESLQVVKKSLDEFFENTQVKALLLKQVQAEKCIQKEFNAKIDARIEGGTLLLDASQFHFDTGSEIQLKGSLGKDLKLNMQGHFLAGPRCISGDVQRCLSGGSGSASFPLKLTGQANDPKGGLDYSALTAKVASCATKFVEAKVKASAKKMVDEVQQGKLDEIQQKAKDNLKKLFR